MKWTYNCGPAHFINFSIKTHGILLFDSSLQFSCKSVFADEEHDGDVVRLVAVLWLMIDE